MTISQCEHERAVVRVVAAGGLPEPLTAHVAACPDCRDTALVAAVLHEEARAAAAEALPDPAAVWRAVRRDERRRTAARAALPITVMTRVALGTCAVAALAGAVWLWPAVAEHFASFARSLTAPAAPTPGGSVIALFTVGVVATLSAALALFETWAGE